MTVDLHELDELDAVGLLAASSAAVRARRLAEVEDLLVLAQWAALHSADPTDPARGPIGRAERTMGNKLVFPGGEGTPGVEDFSLGEIALARGTGVTATINALADVLDLMHRLPMTWAVCRAGSAEIWVARRAARVSRHLPADCVGVVDSAVARMIASEAGGRVIAVAEAKVVEADPGLHSERVETERRRRYVSFSRTDEAGLRTVIARVQAGDAVWVKATVERVAEIVGPQHPDVGADELRSIAFGYLARPAELLALLLEHTDTPEPDPAADAETVSEGNGEQGPDEQEPGLSRALAFPAALLTALQGADVSTLAPKSVLYVHLHESALRPAGSCEHCRVGSVARAEGIGPFGVDQLADLLQRTRLVVKPVIDLSDRVRSTAYEHPEALKERVQLTTGGDYWPYATSTSRRVEYDHPTPYDHDAATGRAGPDVSGADPPDAADPPDPPSQTGTHNSGPLGTRHHRWKTHAGYRSRQAGEGRYVWTTPHGLAFLVDHTGTHRIPMAHARAILDAPAGVDVYPSDLRVEIDVHGL